MLIVNALLRRIWENILSKENHRGRGLHWKFCFWCKFCFSWRQNIHALYASANAERAHYSTLSVYKVRRMRNIERNNLFISSVRSSSVFSHFYSVYSTLSGQLNNLQSENMTLRSKLTFGRMMAHGPPLAVCTQPTHLSWACQETFSLSYS